MKQRPGQVKKGSVAEVREKRRAKYGRRSPFNTREYPRDNGRDYYRGWKRVFVCDACDTTARRGSEPRWSSFPPPTPVCPQCQKEMRGLPMKAKIGRKDTKRRFACTPGF